MIHLKSSYALKITKDRTYHKNKTQKLNDNDKKKNTLFQNFARL